MATVSLATVVDSNTILGKRKFHSKPDALILHLSSSPEPGPVLSDVQHRPPILVNGVLVPHTKRRYKCTHNGCDKSYFKPSRLTEHERSHTGLRPFICERCNKSYLRDTHLQAHSRSHLPVSDRPLACSREGCVKRFWTAQHLRIHEEWHNGSKLLHCVKEGCEETFAKNHQLRTHLSSAHAAPGAKPYPCNHEGCMKSFATNQHLRTHMKIHDDKRYTCVHSTCLPSGSQLPTYFPTWTTLQHHIRTAHPPTCTRASCDGRSFSSQKSLRAHQKLHEQRDLESELDFEMGLDKDEAGGQHPRKRRRGGEIGRDWTCNVEGCGKDFKSKRALATHTKVTHLGRRDYACSYGNCQRVFGYKHLLRRHLAKAHDRHASENRSLSDGDNSDNPSNSVNTEPFDKVELPAHLKIDVITGSAYAKRTLANIASLKALQCPYPHLQGLGIITQQNEPNIGEHIPRETERNCEYAFSRAYDLRRHLQTTHGLFIDKESVNDWVQDQKSTGPNPK
ncbi:hypothetical protein BDZ94DRAFT_1222680 [Collybia nuda]|uniref:C2H2-type domain-containing protein n=1 Tax=Collybia nuda TaxID=64659 RepID=A0A9P5Y1X7_9AGAR|nr:hypothetical protein BDZ94DRAFT_1222680 [Collybia nuda]